MNGWYLLAAYAGFGLLTSVYMWYTGWRDGDLDEDITVAAFICWPAFWAVIVIEGLKKRIRRLKDQE